MGRSRRRLSRNLLPWPLRVPLLNYWTCPGRQETRRARTASGRYFGRLSGQILQPIAEVDLAALEERLPRLDALRCRRGGQSGLVVITVFCIEPRQKAGQRLVNAIRQFAVGEREQAAF